jgi:quinoprotein dehydrogenase-associated probable ABC transporter substrate-binding protein
MTDKKSKFLRFPHIGSCLRRGVSLALSGLLTVGALAVTAPAAYAWELKVCADPSIPPFSKTDLSGFENRIAAVIAEELGATLTFLWYPQGEELMINRFRVGQCDVIIGVPDGNPGMLTTFSYYRSPFVFVYRASAPYDIATFDDPILRELRIGVQPQGGPTHQALLTRGLSANIVQQYPNTYGANPDPLTDPIAAVVNGDVDVVVMWGGGAGYIAAQQDVALEVVPVPPFEPPFIPMYINIAMGVRIGDESLRDLLDIALARRWDEIYAILNEYHVPLMELSKPLLTLEAP